MTDFWPAYNAVVCTHKRLIRDSLRLSKRRKEVSSQTFASRRNRLDRRLHDLLAEPWENRHARRLVNRLRRHACELFPFLDHPGVPEDGAETQAVLMSVFRTLKQRGHNPVSAVLEAVRSYLQTGQLPPLPAKATEIG